MRTLKYIGIALMATLLSVGLPSPAKVTAQPGVSVSFQLFFNSLSPFGRWSNHPQYGSIWIPSVGGDFHPYNTNGRWVMTEYGNTWVSDYDWGWAPFHYGRWFYDDYMGWAWVPDYTWGPGWVNWRTGGGYYGWAPLMPGINIRLAINLPVNFWVFVPQRHFMSARWHHYSVPHARVTNIYHQTTIINNYYTYNNYEYAYGPRSSEIQRHTNSRVPVYTYSNRGNNGSYRESVARTSNAGARKAIEVRERNFDNGAAVATRGSGRSSSVVSPNTRSSSPARTSAPSVAAPRSADPVAAPNGRDAATSGRSTLPSGSSRSREAVTPNGSAAGRSSSRTPVNSGNETYNNRGASASPNREAVSPGRSQVNPAPSTRSSSSGRVAPSGSRSSGARESVSTGRTATPARESVSPARSSSPAARTSTPAASQSRSGRSSSGERSRNP